MRQSQAIHDALKRTIRARGQTYRDAAKVLELSEASIKRLFSTCGLSLQRIEALCDWLGVEIIDVVNASRDVEPRISELTPEQERELLAAPRLLLTTYLALNGWSEEEILEVFAFTKPELTQYLAKLDRMGMIELLPFNRIRRLTARNFSWRPEGPIQQFFTGKVLREFLDTKFKAPGEKMQFVGGMLSRGAVHQMHELIDELAQRLDELVEQDLKLPAEERHGCSLFIGFRPWELSLFKQQRRNPPSKSF